MLLKGSNHDVFQLLKYQWHCLRKPGLTQDSTMYTEKHCVAQNASLFFGTHNNDTCQFCEAHIFICDISST